MIIKNFKFLFILTFIFLSSCSSEASKIKDALNNGPACRDETSTIFDLQNNIVSYGEFINIFFKDIESNFFVYEDKFDKNKNKDVVEVKAKFRYGFNVDSLTYAYSSGEREYFSPNQEYLFQFSQNKNSKNRWELLWVGFPNDQNRNSEPMNQLCNFLNIKNDKDEIKTFSIKNLKDGDYLDQIFPNNAKLMQGIF